MSVYLSNLNDKMKDTNTTLGQISTELGLLAISNAGDLNDPTTMARLVRAGLGETAYPVGSQVTVTHSVYGDLVFDVAAHNFHKKTGDENAPTMTLLMHDTIPDISFDAAELLWANTTGKALPAGTYHFYLMKGAFEGGTGEDGAYQFTTTKDIPANGGFRHSKIGAIESAYQPSNITGGTISTYNASGTTVETGLAVKQSNVGSTELGTASWYQTECVNTVGRFNCVGRSSAGSNDWGESDLRLWLNSAKAANKWYSKQSIFDLPSNFADKAGFMAGFDGAFRRAVGLVNAQNIACTAWNEKHDPYTYYTTSDRFFIPSLEEVAGTRVDTNGDMYEDGARLPLFNEIGTSIYKYPLGSTSSIATYWVRDVAPNDPCMEGYIWQYFLGMGGCADKETIAPACVIC